MPFTASWMDLETGILSEVSQTEKEKYCMTSLICGIQKEMMQMNLQNRKRLTENKLMTAKEEEWGEGIVREFGIDMYTLLYLKWITNKDLLYSTWNSAQCCVSLDGKEAWGRMDTCIHMTQSLYCSPETMTMLLISYTPK